MQVCTSSEFTLEGRIGKNAILRTQKFHQSRGLLNAKYYSKNNSNNSELMMNSETVQIRRQMYWSPVMALLSWLAIDF